MSILNNLYQVGSKWMEGHGPDNDVVISSRIRLARNISGYRFPHYMSSEEANKVVNQIKEVVNQGEMTEAIGRLGFVNLAELTPTERQILVEKHLISPQHAEEPENRAVIIAPDESVSIMVNEEDHLRIQCIFQGLQLEEAWRLADKIDDIFEKELDYSFSEDKGYLTACPTNVGTGVRASVMLHLPCLVMADQVSKLVTAISQLGLATRGYYGEGTEAYGNLFQISNQVTLGYSEEDIVRNLLTVTKKIADQERATRAAIFKSNKKFLEDKVFRAFGTMRYARMMTSQEALQNISYLRLGVELGILTGLTYGRINELIILTRPSFLEKKAGRSLEKEESDALRAKIISKKLSDIRID